MRSLRIRLILLLGTAIVAAATVQFTTSFRAAMQAANKLFDYHMQQMALSLLDGGFEQVKRYSSHNTDNNNFDFVIQVWSEDRTRVYQSRNYSFLPKQGKIGYSTVMLSNGDWRVYAVQTDTRTIQVAQKMSARSERAISLALHSVWPVMPVSLLLFGVVWWVVTSALAPLNRIGHDLANRNVDSLAPVSDIGVPQEVSLLVAELNSLLARMAQALQSQQRFVADAAHELRSPMTALKLQVQTLARAKDGTAHVQAIARLLGGIDRVSRLVEQLLALAREEPSSQELDPGMTPLATSVSQALADVIPFALSRHIELRCGTLAQVDILGDVDSLRIMIRNLLDNAVRYTPERGLVQVDLAGDESAVVLTIQDSGTGIPPQNRARVFDRFYRVPGTSPSGSGLGLAIVKTIADRHGATVELDSASIGGLAVTVTFPSSLNELASFAK
ncbi:MAG TPA: ATP-binding protein [Burkholderiaceae bacterium]|nr:ATP-binding protein [Burkholderiaceae bacterium]